MMTYYDDISEGYEELHEEEQLKKIKLIANYLKPKPLDKLLDVGCGTGVTTSSWQCLRFGIDPAKKLIAKAKKKDGTSYKIAVAEKIPYPDRFFDYVISITAIQNFDDVEKGLREIKRVGKDRFVISALKKSPKIQKIDRLINTLFEIKRRIEEEKDIIWITF
jgi:ubiquinone/menaquinone biosynthesis C-methylase UbiE